MSEVEPMEPYDRETNYSLADGFPTTRQRKRYRKKQNRLYCGTQIFRGGMGVVSNGKGRPTPRQSRGRS